MVKHALSFKGTFLVPSMNKVSAWEKTFQHPLGMLDGSLGRPLDFYVLSFLIEANPSPGIIARQKVSLSICLSICHYSILVYVDLPRSGPTFCASIKNTAYGKRTASVR